MQAVSSLAVCWYNKRTDLYKPANKSLHYEVVHAMPKKLLIFRATQRHLVSFIGYREAYFRCFKCDLAAMKYTYTWSRAHDDVIFIGVMKMMTSNDI